MMTENDIEKLITPLVKRQEDINMYVIDLIARRIKEIGSMTPSDVYKLERMLKTGADVRKINKMLAQMSGLQEKEIKRIISIAAADSYKDSKPFFDYRKMPFIPFINNKPLQQTVEAIQKQTVSTYRNLSRAQAFMLRDRKHFGKLKPTPLAKAYQDIVDEAVQATQYGIVDYHTAMRKTIRQLVDSGLRHVEYNTPSGKHYTQRLDTAVKRNILDGIREINQAVQDLVGLTYGADGKEITVHANPAPDHAPIQGHQFTNRQFEKLQNQKPFHDVKKRKFAPIQRPIGIWNCRHFTYSIIIGVNPPNFTDEQLQKILDDNNRGYTDSKGKHRTMYECTQLMREYETNIRRTKEKEQAYLEAGDEVGAKQAKAEVKQLMKEYQSFCNACGLKPKPENIRI